MISFPGVKAPILEKVCQYFYYRPRYKSRAELAGGTLAQNKAGTNAATEALLDGFEIHPDTAIELVVFASFLDL